MTTFLSGEPKMYEAYNNSKDLYAIIAQSAFHNNYEDNLEFWPEGTELEIDGQKVIAGKKTHLNKAGKERRSTGKVLNLACTYGMGPATAGARLGYTGKEAAEKGAELLNNFFEGFPKVKEAIDQSKAFLKKNGYVEDFLGRRRRLDDINLPKYDVKFYDTSKMETELFNPFLDCEDRAPNEGPLANWRQLIDMYIIYSQLYQLKKNTEFVLNEEMSSKTFDYLKKLANTPKLLTATYNSDKGYKGPVMTNADKIASDIKQFTEVLTHRLYHGKAITTNESLEAALTKYIDKYGKTVPSVPAANGDRVTLMSWTGKIAQAERQCFNARIQGSAASLTKMAMVDIENDELLKKWDAHLIITVHDEVLVECPAFYADDVEKRLPELMVAAAKKGGDDVVQACDPYNVNRWYSDTAAATILEEFKKLEKKGLSRDDALAKVIKNHSEVPETAIIKTIETGADLDF